MTRARSLPVALAALGLALTATPAAADDDDKDRGFRARLSGFNEVHFPPGRRPPCAAPFRVRGAAPSAPRSTGARRRSTTS